MNQPFKQAASVSLHRSVTDRWGDDRLSFTKAASTQRSLRQFRASDPGGTRSTALSLGTFTGKRKFNETVGSKDKDIYQLTFGDLTDFRVTLRNRSQVDLVGEILNSQGQIVTFGGDRLSVKVKAGQTFNNLYEEFPSGVYFLRVRSQGAGKNTYQLKLAAANTFPSLPDCGCTT